ncbi:hypothetical protein [Variovorax sp.]|uniref:hypothetical protein n=1 Tax=Variovorax sp. TaxID=1871043 RepID=UPI003BAC6BAF
MGTLPVKRGADARPARRMSCAPAGIPAIEDECIDSRSAVDPERPRFCACMVAGEIFDVLVF